jgi:hypothetical protein
MQDPCASVARVESEFLRSLPPDQNAPTPKQLHNKKHYQKRKRLPTGDTMDNIVQLFVREKKFVREAGTIPFLYFIIAADDAVRLLQAHGRVLFVDGTFNLVEGKMVLTTIMVLVGKIGVPVAWLLCNSQTQDYYTYFFRFMSSLVLEVTGHTLSPLVIFADFEDAL